MSNIYDIFETCLQSLESGKQMDAVLSQYPDYAEELRPMLEASLRAVAMVGSEPSPEMLRNGREKLLKHAAELRATQAPARRPRRMIPGFQRFALSFSLAALFLLSGTGLVSASSSALPGENLYPVKRTWEDVRLFFVFNHTSRQALQTEFENERLHEVNNLLTEGRDEMIQFAGVWSDVNGVYYVSGIRVVILDHTKLPEGALQNGVAVAVTGYTNTAGYVEAESIQLLPAGTSVPTGEPPEVETETEDHTTPNPGLNTNNQNDNSEVNTNDQNDNSEVNTNEQSGNVNESSNESNININHENTNDHSSETNQGDHSGSGGGGESSGGGDHSGSETEH